MAVISGRVIPLFTNNGVPGALATRQATIEQTALGSVLALLLADTLQVRGAALAALLALGAASHLARWSLWRPWKTLPIPLVWVLHVAYLWIPVHLALRAASTLGYVSASIATHSLTVGAIGGLTLGMMTRTARGHTGRPLRADAFDVACYVLVSSAALVRVCGPLIASAAVLQAVLGFCRNKDFGLRRYAMGSELARVRRYRWWAESADFSYCDRTQRAAGDATAFPTPHWSA